MDRQPEAALALEGIRFSWPGSAFALEIDALEVARGEAVMVRGPSGSGKSTLLSLICGIVTPAAGEIRVVGEAFSALPSARRDRVRAERLGVIFQMFNLLPYASPVDNVLLPLAFAPKRSARVGRDQAGAARQLLSGLGLSGDVIGARRADRLSVGQQQRVAVARALIGGPDIVVADEPTSALDADAKDTFLALMAEQVRAAGATLLMVSHDESLAHRFDRVLALDEVARLRRGAAA
ncbi:MAG: ABC transporter ATP-binding protein [Pseudomonadota bacterium]